MNVLTFINERLRWIFPILILGAFLITTGCDSSSATDPGIVDPIPDPDPNPTSDPEPEPEPVLDPEPDPEPKPDPKPEPEPEPQPEVNPKVLTFNSDSSCVIPGTEVSLSWSTENAEHVYLNGAEVNSQQDSHVVTPSGPQSFQLKVVSGGKEESKTVSVSTKQGGYLYGLKGTMALGKPILSASLSGDGTMVALVSQQADFQGPRAIYKVMEGQSALTELKPNTALSNWTAVAISPLDSKSIFAAKTGRVYYSKNGGQLPSGGSRWEGLFSVQRNTVDLAINTLEFSVKKPHYLLIGATGTAFLFDTRDNSRRELTVFNRLEVTRFAGSSQLTAAATPSALFVSSDDISWQSVPAGPWTSISALAVHGQKILVGHSRGLAVLDWSQATKTWVDTVFTQPVNHIALREEETEDATASMIYLSTPQGIHSSFDLTAWDKIAELVSTSLLDGNHLLAVNGGSIALYDREWIYAERCVLPTIHVLSTPRLLDRLSSAGWVRGRP